MKLFPSLLILITALAGCKTNSPSPSASIIPTPSLAPVASPSTSKTCVEQPAGSLAKKDVKPVTLTTKPINESGELEQGRFLGYSFEAKAGQRFNFSSKDKICTQVYTPSNKVLSGNELPENGNYIVQVASLGGNTSFSVEMGLDSLLSSTPTNATSQSGKLTQDQALRVVKSWLDSKSKVFASPWDRNAINQYTTGPLHTDITKTDGSIAWLKKYKAYYTFNPYEVKALGFSSSEQRPSIKTQVTEDKTLHTPEGNDPSQTGKSTSVMTYFFALEDGIWKIYDYRTEEG